MIPKPMFPHNKSPSSHFKQYTPPLRNVPVNPVISDELLRKRFGTTIYERGLSYFKQKAITNLEQTHNTIKGLSSAATRAEPYQVWVSLSSGGIIDAFCECPAQKHSEKGHCKHIVALLLTWKESMTDKNKIQLPPCQPTITPMSPSLAIKTLQGTQISPKKASADKHSCSPQMLQTLGIKHWNKRDIFENPDPTGETPLLSTSDPALLQEIADLKAQLKEKDSLLKNLNNKPQPLASTEKRSFTDDQELPRNKKQRLDPFDEYSAATELHIPVNSGDPHQKTNTTPSPSSDNKSLMSPPPTRKQISPAPRRWSEEDTDTNFFDFANWAKEVEKKSPVKRVTKNPSDAPASIEHLIKKHTTSPAPGNGTGLLQQLFFD
eukprot:TRINITY_DN15080_c0_g1_i1.p1 TRINITY_DN15080_c0_g1~~TRINITY_DN15080_c0_g1_i1.p1  ORF type:complete len:378 (-),score=62.91 TRINITY_DN15080_c0_g1_i1:7-1140(-)